MGFHIHRGDLLAVAAAAMNGEAAHAVRAHGAEDHCCRGRSLTQDALNSFLYQRQKNILHVVVTRLRVGVGRQVSGSFELIIAIWTGPDVTNVSFLSEFRRVRCDQQITALRAGHSVHGTSRKWFQFHDAPPVFSFGEANIK